MGTTVDPRADPFRIRQVPAPAARAAADHPPGERAPRRAWFSFRRPGTGVGHCVLVLFTVVIIWGSTWAFLHHEYHQLEATAARDAANLVRSFDETVVRGFEEVDETLIFLRESYLRDPAGFDLRSWGRSRLFVSGLLAQIVLVGPDGVMLQSNLGPPGNRIYLSDRPHIRVQRDATDDRMFISVPVLGRNSGRWTLNCTRRISGPDGSFRGVVVVSVDIAYLERFYQSLSIGNGIVLLAGSEDGVIRARAPEREGVIGQELPPVARAHLLSGEPQGSYRAVSRADGTMRMISFRRIAGYPLVVAVGLDENEVLAPYRRDRTQYVAASAGVTLLVTAVGWLLVRQRRRTLASQAALTATLENISQGVIMVDAGGRVPVFNRRAAELLDLPQDTLGRHPFFRDILRFQIDRGEFGPPDRLDPEFLRFVEGGGIRADYDVYERVRANGTVLEFRTRPLPQGGAVRTYTDITDRRANEEALAAARDAAEAAGRARSEFLAVMSHEIRTPMNGIIGVAGLLLDMQLGASERQYARIILDSGNHLLQLINDILDFSRLDAGRVELEEAVFDLRATVRKAVDLLALAARSKGLALELAVAGDVPEYVRGDAGRLRQVLLNLIGNGVKFTAAGSVRVSVTRLAPEPEPEPKPKPEREWLGFAVSDTGIGIPPEAQGRLFTEFTQVDSSISRRFGGSGLGLAISRRLIECMEGTISVESTPGQGSTFRFELPLRRCRPGEAPAAEVGTDTGTDQGAAAGGDGTGPLPRRLRVLVAEDNATNRLVAIRMLERMGHRAEAVSNGAEAVAAVQANRFDLVLMDVMMPEMDGLAATAAIRKLPGPAARLPVIGLTANARRADEAACLAAGMDRFATKPVSTGRLATVIAQVMRERGGEPASAEAAAVLPTAAGFEVSVLEGLARDIGPDGAVEVVRLFAETVPGQMQEMLQNGAAGRLTELVRQTHSLASTARSVGLLQLGQATADLEDAVAVGRTEALAERLAGLQRQLLEGLAALHAWLDRQG